MANFGEQVESGRGRTWQPGHGSRNWPRIDPFLTSVAVLLLIVALAFLGPLLLGLDPYRQDLHGRLTPPFWQAGGTRQHILGTDQLGRDMVARLLYGGRISLSVGLISTVICSSLGVLVGMISGYYGGPVEFVVMRIAETEMTFPFVILALVTMSIFNPSVGNLILVFSIAGWPLFAKVTRGLTLAHREQDFIMSARAVGCRDLRILLIHVLPNILGYVLVLVTLHVPVVIFAEAGLSFLGVGIDPPEPSWGVMLGEGRQYLSNAWWLAVWPGVALVLTVITINYVGDTLERRISGRGHNR